MRRPSLLPAIFIGSIFVLASCASPSSAPDETTGGDPPDQATESGAPDDTPQATEEAEATSGDGGSNGGAPALADGPWTDGQGAVTVSGGLEWATDEPITTDVSQTTDAKTELAYNSDDTYVTIFINLTGVPFHASVDAPEFSASSEDCDVTYATATDTEISGEFSCVADEVYSFVGETPSDAVMIEGTFTATR